MPKLHKSLETNRDIYTCMAWTRCRRRGASSSVAKQEKPPRDLVAALLQRPQALAIAPTAFASAFPYITTKPSSGEGQDSPDSTEARNASAGAPRAICNGWRSGRAECLLPVVRLRDSPSSVDGLQRGGTRDLGVRSLSDLCVEQLIAFLRRSGVK